ncbi:sensor domain-containing diguanylate cyclase [Thiomicrorhabdus immobilis]|uniref:diguanylate cyclase n=1 Tax=Thiomicrorhabdus immobilis TaxID=2791037 RepID=A0ABN6D234_9GAMM|nr:sensor domain-containing diguanylate cyclase [Thiomicrorhabdus immobilis]BCN94182.1 sensor domain-containing diguanylate cyclase [Thiomicrorhabdus immobilis]
MYKQIDCYPSNKLFILSSVLFIALMIGGFTYIKEINEIKSHTKSSIENRAKQLQSHIGLLLANSMALKKVYENEYKHFLAHHSDALFEDKDFQYLPQYNLTIFTPKNTESSHGTAQILGPKATSNIQLQVELKTAEALTSVIEVILNEIQSTVAIYYTSKQGFSYRAPQHPIDQFRFNADQYNKPFWRQSIPENNPLNKPVFSLIGDNHEHHRRFGLSNPIIVNGQFLGVISIEMTTNEIDNLLSINQDFADSVLLDNHNKISYSQDYEAIGKTLEPTNGGSLSTWQRTDNGWLYKAPIIPGELYIAHQLTDESIMQEAKANSLLLWSLLMLGVILSLLVMQLFCTAKKNRNLMLVDPLTSLYNRRGFQIISTPIFAHLKRHQSPWALLLIDIDFFKKVNDTHGHIIGDEVLVKVADFIHQSNRGESIVGRWGGEEFLVLLPGTPPQEAMEAAERIRKNIAENLLISNQEHVTVSIGIAPAMADDNFEKTVHNADLALYQAKHQGRNISILYNPTDAKAINQE